MVEHMASLQEFVGSNPTKNLLSVTQSSHLGRRGNQVKILGRPGFLAFEES